MTNLPIADAQHLTQHPQIDILYSSSNSKLDPIVFEDFMSRIPLAMQLSIRKFHRWEDAQLGLFGKILLMEGLNQLGIDASTIEKMQYTKFRRPYLTSNFDFNISHSGNTVVCAISRQYKVGVDIEKIKPINTEEFTGQFTASELDQIESADDPLREFYRWWTKKEAIIKADGKGLSIPLKSIAFKSPWLAEIGNGEWHLHEIAINDDYCCHIATDCPVGENIRLQKYIL